MMQKFIVVLLCYASFAMSAISISIPIIDISPLLVVTAGSGSSVATSSASYIETISAISSACTDVGFFYIKGHGVPGELISHMKLLSRRFFSLSLVEKETINMARGGKAWRGYFANGVELTSGLPDQKEGIYFGTELPVEETRYLHGPNQWLAGELGGEMKSTVLEYMSTMKSLGDILMRAIASSLEIDTEKFGQQFIKPTELFRIFNYPPHDEKFGVNALGVGEHTDYGYLTILFQDDDVVDVPGLQVRDLVTNEWINAPSIPGTFVINLGDALEHNTGGLMRATPHRYQQRVGATASRLSFPYFFDPSFDAEMISIVPFLQGKWKERQETLQTTRSHDSQQRWDKRNPSQFQGKYGDYLLSKVSKVFPDLAKTESITKYDL